MTTSIDSENPRPNRRRTLGEGRKPGSGRKPKGGVRATEYIWTRISPAQNQLLGIVFHAKGVTDLRQYILDKVIGDAEQCAPEHTDLLEQVRTERDRQYTEPDPRGLCPHCGEPGFVFSFKKAEIVFRCKSDHSWSTAIK
jgi:hypothetical protein